MKRNFHLKNNVILTLFFFSFFLLMINLVIEAKVCYYQNQIAAAYGDAELYASSPKTQEIAANKKASAKKVDSYYSTKLDAIKNSSVPYIAFMSRNQGICTLISVVASTYLVLVLLANNSNYKNKKMKRRRRI